MTPPPPTPTLFPYTTLFRSIRREPLGAHGRETRDGRTPRHRPGGDRGRVRGHRRWDTPARDRRAGERSEEHTSELQSRENLVCRLLLEKKNKRNDKRIEHLD